MFRLYGFMYKTLVGADLGAFVGFRRDFFGVSLCAFIFLGVFFDKYNPPITIKMKNIFVGLLVMLYCNMFILYGPYDNFRKRVWIYIFLNGFVHKIYGQIGNNVIKNM